MSEQTPRRRRADRAYTPEENEAAPYRRRMNADEPPRRRRTREYYSPEEFIPYPAADSFDTMPPDIPFDMPPDTPSAPPKRKFRLPPLGESLRRTMQLLRSARPDFPFRRPHGVGDLLGAEGVGGDDAAFAHGVGDQRGQFGQACDGCVGGGVVDGHLGDLSHGVAEGGRVGLPVDGAGAGRDVADVDVAGEAAGGAGRDDDGCLDEGEGARGRGGGVGQADAGGDDQDGAAVEDAEHEALGLVGAREDGLGRLVVPDGRELVQEGRGLHVHGGLDDGVDADALGEAEVHRFHRRGRGPPRSRSPRAGVAALYVYTPFPGSP